MFMLSTMYFGHLMPTCAAGATADGAAGLPTARLALHQPQLGILKILDLGRKGGCPRAHFDNRCP